MSATAQAISTQTPPPASTPSLATLDMSLSHWFETGEHWEQFRRLRREAPVHYCPESLFGPFWSVSRYADVMAVDTDHKRFSSEPTITLVNAHPDPARRNTMFIAMDQPKHTEQRKAVNNIMAPTNLAEMEKLIRSRVIKIIEDLPVGETFNWVDRVSIELTTQMLATLFNFPFEDRRLLTYWSDVATNIPPARHDDEAWAKRDAVLMECLGYFKRLWAEREHGPAAFDLVTMLAQNGATKNMPPREFLGNIILLIVGGNDTTRNSISGGLHFLSQNPGEWDKVRKDRSLIPNMVAEIIRYQTPLAYMARRALVDVEMHDKTIKAGDKVAMWYISANRDETKFENPDRFWIDRPNARQHISFGFGIHRCMGNRLAEMQLRILWEELLQRYPRIDVMGPPVRVPSSFVHGISELPVRLAS
jgi:cytochrome P450